MPSTLLIPLAARAHGGRYFPWLDCHDAVAQALLTQLGADVSSTLDDLPTVLHVLWRTRAIKEAGAPFLPSTRRPWASTWGVASRTTFSGWTRGPTSGLMRTCLR